MVSIGLSDRPIAGEPIPDRPQTEDQSKIPVWHRLLGRTIKPFRVEFDGKNEIIKSLKKYICDQCSDEFLHESSLVAHLERRSLLLTHFCEDCNRKESFFNRCTLLSHIRSHVCDQSLISEIISKVLVQPIDLKHLLAKKSSAIGVKDVITSNGCNKSQSVVSDVNSSTLSCTRKANDDPKCTQLVKLGKKAKKLNPVSDSIDTKYVIKKSTNSDLKCCQCKCSFNSLWTREQHFSNRQLALPLSQCRLCPTICATNCSQSLHNKLHSDPQLSDFCPECGTKLDESDHKQLLTHIIIDCLHLSRRLLYICMYCSEKMASLADSMQHIKSFHTRQQFQCRECHYIFKEQTQFDQHQTHSHSNSSEALVLLKCPVCGTELNSANDYSFHLTTHRKYFLDFTSFVFVCLQCEQSFNTKPDLKSHFTIDHLKDRTETEIKDYLIRLTREAVIRFKLKFNFSSDNTSGDKLKNNSLLNKVPKGLEESTERGFDSNSQNKRIKIVDSNETKSPNHPNNANTSLNDNWFECSECGLSFPFVQTLKRHLILEHRIHDVESYINTTYVKIPIAVTAPQFPKEVGEEKLSQILTDSEHSNDTSCPICSQKFSDSKELKIHGRVHGLAFIKSCQRKNFSFN